MAAIFCELKRLKQLLVDLRVQHLADTRLYCDSQSALYIVKNLMFHERTKYIEDDYHFVRDDVSM